VAEVRASIDHEPDGIGRTTAVNRRLPVVVALIAAGVSGCSLLQPNPDCRINEQCDAVLAAARSAASFDGARVVVTWGRARGTAFHAEVHVCYSDGRNVLVDVMSQDGHPALRAGVRDTPWVNPPCR
jgi:hypothetical protein